MKRVNAAILALLLCSAATADVVHLKDGRKIEGKVTDLGEKLKIERPGGSMTVDKSEVERIEVKEFVPPAASTTVAGPSRKGRPRYKVRLVGSITSIDADFVLFRPAEWGGNSPVIRGPIPGPDGLRLEWGLQTFAGTIDEAVAAAKKESETGTPGGTISPVESFALGGRPCAQFEIRHTGKDGPLITLIQLMKNSDGLSRLAFTAPEKLFEKRWFEVDRMLRSVKWLKPNQLTREQKDRFMDLYERGYHALVAKKAPEALALYKEALEIVPELGVLQSAIGHAHLQLKDYHNAVVATQKALKFEPDNVLHLWQLAMSYYHWGKEEDAISALRRVMDADPENDEAFVNCGILYANKGKISDAKMVWKSGAVKNPESVALHLLWGQAAEQQDKLNEAQEAYEKALKADPKNADAAQRLQAVIKKKKA